MSKKTKIAIIMFLFFGLCQSAFCYTLTQEELNKIIISKAKKEAQAQLQKYNPEIKIEILGLSKKEIVTNEKTSPKVELISYQNNFQPISYKKVIIKNQKNETISILPVTIKTSVYKNVLVAAENIQFNKTIDKTNTILEKREISKNLNNVLEKIDENLIATKNYPKGSLILSNSTKKQATISKNSTIDIVFKSNKGLNIKLQGKALNDGIIGQTILVRSDKYNKTYSATVSSKNEVIVGI